MSDVLEASQGQIKVRVSDADNKNDTMKRDSVLCTYLVHAGV